MKKKLFASFQHSNVKLVYVQYTGNSLPCQHVNMHPPPFLLQGVQANLADLSGQIDTAGDKGAGELSYDTKGAGGVVSRWLQCLDY